MASQNLVRLFNGYVDRFGSTVEKVVTKRTDISTDDKINIIDALLEILQLHLENPEESVDYSLVGNILAEKIIKPLRNQATPLYNSKLWQYFERQSNSYTDYLESETGRTSFFEEDYLTIELHTSFLDKAQNYLSISQTLLYLSSERPGNGVELNGANEGSGRKEFTLRRQVLVMYYLDKAHNISNGSDRTHYAHLIELLTGKNYKNIYDYVREPFPPKTSSRLVEDLKYIRDYFVKLGNDQIITLIDKDIQLHK